MKLAAAIALYCDGNISNGISPLAEVSPIPTFHPPSKKNKKPVPADNPDEKDNKFLDVEKRNSKGTQFRRGRLTKQVAPTPGPAIRSVPAPAPGSMAGMV